LGCGWFAYSHIAADNNNAHRPVSILFECEPKLVGRAGRMGSMETQSNEEKILSDLYGKH
jgi:hypothetical protein